MHIYRDSNKDYREVWTGFSSSKTTLGARRSRK
jgi:hypothetical protein